MASKRMLHEAALQALVRFGPQFDALDQLTRTAKQTYGATVNAADVSSASTRSVVAHARPQVASIYDEATHGQEALRGALADTLGGLHGQGTDLIKAAAAAETANADTHMREAKMQALQDLTNRGLQADAGRSQAVLAAGTRLHSDLVDIGHSRVSLAGQEGAFTAATLADLGDKAAVRAFTARQNAASRRNSRDIAASHDATSSANTQARIDAAAALAAQKAGKRKWQSPGAHGKARDLIELGLTQARMLQAGGRSRSEIEGLLVGGRSPQTVKDNEGKSVKVPGVAKVPQLYAAAALDVLFNGHVSARTRRLLNRRGLTVRGLGFPPPPTPAQARQQAQAHALGGLGGLAAALGHALGL